MTDKETKSLWQKAIDFAFGSPKAYLPAPQMNRKQKRMQQHVLRVRAAASKRRKHEGRK